MFSWYKLCGGSLGGLQDSIPKATSGKVKGESERQYSMFVSHLDYEYQGAPNVIDMRVHGKNLIIRGIV